MSIRRTSLSGRRPQSAESRRRSAWTSCGVTLRVTGLGDSSPGRCRPSAGCSATSGTCSTADGPNARPLRDEPIERAHRRYTRTRGGTSKVRRTSPNPRTAARVRLRVKDALPAASATDRRHWSPVVATDRSGVVRHVEATRRAVAGAILGRRLCVHRRRHPWYERAVEHPRCAWAAVVLAAACALAGPACERGISDCQAAGEFLGLSQAQAQALAKDRGWTVRVLRDGAVGTADLRSDRVNVQLENDRVTSATRC